MTKKNITIIGAGNMGKCLLGGLIANQYPLEKIWISDPSPILGKELKQEFKQNLHFTSDNLKAVLTADIIILAVKPFIVPKVLQELAEFIRHKEVLIISVAAGVTVQVIQHYLGENNSIVRAMPNVPALIGCGATALFGGGTISCSQKKEAESIFESVGFVTWVEDEELLNAVTAISGSGPAYFFLMMDALQNAGEKCGLPPHISRLLTLQTAYGASRMALESNKSLLELQKQVTSKGGTTEQALLVFENANMREIFSDAVRAAEQRAKELAKKLIKEMEL